MVTFVTTGVASAQTAPRAGKQESIKHEEYFAKELNLTPDQQEKLTQNRKVQHEKVVRLRKALKEKEEKLGKALKGPAVTRAALEPIANDIKSLQAQLIDNRIDSILAVKQVLTPEQAAKFEEMAQQYRQKNREQFRNRRPKLQSDN